MNKRETAQALMDSVQKGDFEEAKSMLADDFQFKGQLSEPINAETWIKMSVGLRTAFPDLNYHFKMIGTQGDVVRSISQMSGTQSASSKLREAASNQIFSAKPEKTKITVKGNKITSWAVEPADGAGLKAMLDQLAVKKPLAV